MPSNVEANRRAAEMRHQRVMLPARPGWATGYAAFYSQKLFALHQLSAFAGSGTE